MTTAIFWLPLVAGILLGGIAAACWYGGDKTFAVWIAFVGCICLLLTAALQVQQYVWQVANQPKLSLHPLEPATILRWDPPTSYQMQPNTVTNPTYGAWAVPRIQIRNAGAIAQDATIQWSVDRYEIQSLIASARRFQGHAVAVEQDRITLGPSSGPGTRFIHPMTWAVSLPMPFIAREVETFIPLQLWEHAALFFIATMGDEPNAKSAPFIFNALIKWNIPEDAKPTAFRLKVTAQNAKPAGVDTPVFLANIRIEVEGGTD